VYGLVNALKRESLTAVLIRELSDREQIGESPEEFVADGLIVLSGSYVGNHHMRFLEVVKSRGSRHIAIPSLLLFTEQGIRVLPPFQTPFYRFEEAVSTGIPQLDDLLGGGIPYGAFYLMEIDSALHQDILDAGFAREAMAAGDVYVRVAGQSDERSRWRALMRAAGLDRQVERGVESQQVVFLCPRACEGNTPVTRERLEAEVERVCATVTDRPVRLQVDISRLMALLPPKEGYAALGTILARCRQARTVVMGVVSPKVAPAQELEKLRTEADGLVRIWTEGSYSYLQVVKTVNSARTPAYAMNEIPEPPFVEILTQ
jgi:circadian clock protein KaiC